MFSPLRGDLTKFEPKSINLMGFELLAAPQARKFCCFRQAVQASSADQDKMWGVEHQFADGLQSFRKPSECTLLSKKNPKTISLIRDLSSISSRYPSSETDPDSEFQPNLTGFLSFSLRKKCCMLTFVF